MARTVAREVVAEARRRQTMRPAVELPPADGAAVRAVYGAWLVGLAAFALVILNVDLLLPAGASVRVVRLVLGCTLLGLGVALVADRLPVRRLLAERLTRRARGGRRRLVGAALTVLAIAWVATGVLELLRGSLDLGR